MSNLHEIFTSCSWRNTISKYLNKIWQYLLVSTSAVSFYPASMLNLVWFANEKCLSCQHWATWKHEIGRPVIQKLNILQARCDNALSCSNMWKTNYPHRHVNSIALHVFVAATVKLQIFDTNVPDFYSATTGKNFMQIAHHLSELWKRGLFYETPRTVDYDKTS